MVCNVRNFLKLLYDFFYRNFVNIAKVIQSYPKLSKSKLSKFKKSYSSYNDYNSYTLIFMSLTKIHEHLQQNL